jgi:hypothetical protein
MLQLCGKKSIRIGINYTSFQKRGDGKKHKQWRTSVLFASDYFLIQAKETKSNLSSRK